MQNKCVVEETERGRACVRQGLSMMEEKSKRGEYHPCIVGKSGGSV